MESDLTDARVVNINQRKKDELPSLVSIGSKNIPIDSISYDMNHLQRGKCLVFSHQTFDRHTRCKPRPSTDKDARAIIRCFRKLQFEVIRYNDASYEEICDAMVKIADEDHSNRDCIAIIILTHGDEESLWARDRKYSTDALFAPLKGDRCSTLLGKPKIFIIQASRGKLQDSGLTVMAPAQDVIDGRKAVFRIPTIADFVVYYSTAPGHHSFQNTQNSSYFIQTLVSVLEEYSYSEYRLNFDLLTLFTFVNQRVAFGFTSNVSKDKSLDQKKQIPCISSMLTKLITFAPKPVQSKNV